ncbi:replication-relaxation family protein [Streptomyces sp. NPDC090053]|uniref:replication-relaxation family protein n=1 Tax=Streptomyces sp. NPDC090053 TaxID=3365932 RepID=UPI003806AEC5
MRKTAALQHTTMPPVREQVLAVLLQHRAATTVQLRSLLNVPPPHPETLRQCLRTLRTAQLVTSVDRAHHPSVWSLSTRGRATVTAWPQFQNARRYRGTAGGLRSVHTLTVTRAALAFLEDARARGDEFTALDWTTEVSHSVRDGASDGERALIADALLRYTRAGEQRSMLRAFVEVDRATMSSEQLATKLITYARFHAAPAVLPGRRHTGTVTFTSMPPWQRSYPVFPRTLFILTGAGPRALSQRIADLRAMVRQHPMVSAFAHEVPLGAAILEDIEEQGASAAVWTPLGERSVRCGWLDL